MVKLPGMGRGLFAEESLYGSEFGYRFVCWFNPGRAGELKGSRAGGGAGVRDEVELPLFGVELDGGADSSTGKTGSSAPP